MYFSFCWRHPRRRRKKNKSLTGKGEWWIHRYLKKWRFHPRFDLLVERDFFSCPFYSFIFKHENFSTTKYSQQDIQHTFWSLTRKNKNQRKCNIIFMCEGETILRLCVFFFFFFFFVLYELRAQMRKELSKKSHLTRFLFASHYTDI